jgi:hypothetical protein
VAGFASDDLRANVREGSPSLPEEAGSPLQGYLAIAEESDGERASISAIQERARENTMGLNCDKKGQQCLIGYGLGHKGS